MIDKEYLKNFKESYIYSMIKDGVKKKHLKDVLLGEGEYGMPFLPIAPLTVPSKVIITLHLLVEEKVVTNKEINYAFQCIEINKNNVCLLLDYIKTYLSYRKLESILEINYKIIFERIIKNENQYKDLSCYNNFLSLIHDAMAELD
ncbi:hypothetical protein [Bacteroides sp.]